MYSRTLTRTSNVLTGGLRNGIHCTSPQWVCPTRSVHGTVAARITADHATNAIDAVIERRSPGAVIRYYGAAFSRCTTSLVMSVPAAAHAIVSELKMASTP